MDGILLKLDSQKRRAVLDNPSNEKFLSIKNGPYIRNLEMYYFFVTMIGSDHFLNDRTLKVT